MNIAYRKRVLPLIGALLLILFLCSCAKTAPAATPEVTAAPAVSSEPAVETVVFTDPVLEAKIRPTGFFRNKARNIRALMQVLVEKHGGHLPDDFDTLCELPGIGRKTANLLVATAFGRRSSRVSACRSMDSARSARMWSGSAAAASTASPAPTSAGSM